MKRTKDDFIEVLEQVRGIVFKVARSYFSDSDDQKDLAQDIIIHLWQSFHKYDAKYAISTWAYRISLNVAISAKRKSSTKAKHLVNSDTSMIDIVEDLENDEEKQSMILHQFIDELDDLNKALMILYLDGNSHEKIAEILEITKSNVGTKIGRIKTRLKEHFKNLEIWLK